MLNLAICDNNKKDSKKIETIIKNYMEKQKINYEIYLFQSGETLLDFHGNLDAIFLDIAMEGMNGIQAGKKLHEWNRNIKIIYTTSYQQYALQAMNNVHAFAYLEKPVRKSKAEQQLDEIVRYVKEEHENMELMKFEIIEITRDGRVDSKIKSFEINDIYYFEYINRKIKIKLRNEEYFFVDKMKYVSAKMQPYNFEVCHQNFLVNLIHIKKIKGYEVYLNNNEKLPVSQKKSAEFRKKLNTFIQRSI